MPSPLAVKGIPNSVTGERGKVDPEKVSSSRRQNLREAKEPLLFPL